jgi:hypothetical protein
MVIQKPGDLRGTLSRQAFGEIEAKHPIAGNGHVAIDGVTRKVELPIGPDFDGEVICGAFGNGSTIIILLM